MIGGIHDAVFICIFPPAPTQVTRVTRAKLRGSVHDLLKASLERQRVLYDECIVVQTLPETRKGGRLDYAALCNITAIG